MAIERCETDRPTLLAYRVRGRITRDAIEGMASEVAAAFDSEGEIDLLVLLQEWDGIDAGAVLSGERAKVQARSIRHVRRYGVVGAPAWAESLINAFDTLLPLEARTFAPEDEASAWAWVGEP
jgi:hypothetical protein